MWPRSPLHSSTLGTNCSVTESEHPSDVLCYLTVGVLNKQLVYFLYYCFFKSARVALDSNYLKSINQINGIILAHPIFFVCDCRDDSTMLSLFVFFLIRDHLCP